MLGDRIETVTRTYAQWMADPHRGTAAKIQQLYGDTQAAGKKPGTGKGGGPGQEP